jgi:catechol 2,3-dioxygenase-like lactoylglutathione lyase family enzyme
MILSCDAVGMPRPRFGMVALLVADLPRSIAFYRHLGVEFPADAEERPAVQVPIGGDHQLVLTTRFAKLIPGYEVQSGLARIVLEFFVDDDVSVDRTYAELVDAGYGARRPPFRTDFGAYICMIDDPDENVVLVTAT